MAPVDARKRVCLMAGICLLFTAAVPMLPTPAWATVGMSLSYFCAAAWSANMYTIPVDLYGAERAAFGVGALLFAYGGMQTVLSKPIASVIQSRGFTPVCIALSVTPLIAQVALRFVRSDSDPRSVTGSSRELTAEAFKAS
jgi:ACS family hexuronate transporter-like MFS transporter